MIDDSKAKDKSLTKLGLEQFDTLSRISLANSVERFVALLERVVEATLNKLKDKI